MSVSFTRESEDLFVVSVEGVLTFNELIECQNHLIGRSDCEVDWGNYMYRKPDRVIMSNRRIDIL